MIKGLNEFTKAGCSLVVWIDRDPAGLAETTNSHLDESRVSTHSFDILDNMKVNEREGLGAWPASKSKKKKLHHMSLVKLK